MPLFEYKAVSPTGETVRGTMEAGTLDGVIARLQEGGNIPLHAKQAGQGLPVFGLDFGNPDFVNYAESYGAHGHRVESTEQLPGLLSSCLAETGVSLVEVPVDYSENERVLIEELRSLTGHIQ